MKIKSLLLGTAAAFAVAGGAQAADLAVAVEPVDYVKVCDAFGTGYYYIPGTDTCLKISGYVREDIWFHDKSDVLYGIEELPDGNDPDVLPDYKYYSSSWEMKTKASVSFTAKTMSDMGPIVTHFTFISESDGSSADTKYVEGDGWYGQIGPLLFGWTASTFDYEGGFTYDGAIRSDTKTDQVRFSYNMGGWGIHLGIEDPRDRWWATSTGDMPDIILALNGGAGGWDWKASVGVTDRIGVGTGWGAQLGATVDLGGGAKLRGNIAYSNNAANFAGGSVGLENANGYGDWWSAFLSGTVALSGNVSAAATVSYLAGEGGYDEVQAALGAYWAVTGNSHIGGEVLYKDQNGSDSVGFHIRLKTSF